MTDDEKEELRRRVYQKVREHPGGEDWAGIGRVKRLHIGEWSAQEIGGEVWVDSPGGGLYECVLFLRQFGRTEIKDPEECKRLLDYLRREMVLDDLSNI